MPDIELSSLIEERSIKVELNDECLNCAIFMLGLSFDDMVEFIDLINDSDAMSSISELTRFNNPYISHFTFFSSFLLLLFFHFFYLILSSFVVSYKSLVLEICEAFLYVES